MRRDDLAKNILGMVYQRVRLVRGELVQSVEVDYPFYQPISSRSQSPEETRTTILILRTRTIVNL